MSLKALVWVMESAPTNNHTELAVLYALAERAADDGTSAWPSQTWIAERARCSPRTVKRQLKNLEASGIISRGDQRIVSHIRGDRRPVVWDLDLSLTRTLTTGHSDTSLPDERGDNVSPREGVRGVTGGGTGCQPGSHEVSPVVERGDTAMAYKPSLTVQNQKKNRGRGRGGEESLRSVTPASEPTASLAIPSEWIDEPRRARCAAHAGVESPPPCRGCGTARHRAEVEQHRRERIRTQAMCDRRAERDACDECDDNGLTSDGHDRVMRCSHDPAENAARRARAGRSA